MKKKLTSEQIAIGAKYLAISNLGHAHPKPFESLEEFQKWYVPLYRIEVSEVDEGIVANEAASFRRDLEKGEDYFNAILIKQLPFLFKEIKNDN